MTGGTPAGQAFRRPRIPRKWFGRWTLLIVPALLFLGAFFGVPLLRMAITSLTEPSPANYLVFTESPIYLRVLGTTFRTAFIVTVICLVLGYPYAYAMHHAGPRLAAVLTVAVLFPFWSSLLVRTYAWTVLLQDSGVLNSVLQELGLIDRPLALMRNSLGVTIGMSQILLPFMILPIYAVMRRIDPDLTPAAASLGARPFTAFRRIFLPLSLPGILVGSLLVFVLALGFYITPALLGSPRDAMLSELIVNQVSQQLDFGVGAALAMVLLVLTLGLLWAASRPVRIGEALGGAE
jgi:putative spermidine/putrescine transport system permease protein